MAVLTCPVCQGQMRELNKDGVLIDVCTQCRGVWLDRGELEKLASFMQPMDAYRQPQQQVPPPYDGTMRDPRQGAPYDDYRERRRDYDDDDDDDRRYRNDPRGDHQRSKVSRFLDFFD
jgi:Zn-finger nucleic acid-binding protein